MLLFHKFQLQKVTKRRKETVHQTVTMCLTISFQRPSLLLPLHTYKPTETCTNTNSFLHTHSPQPGALGLDPVRTTVELLPLLPLHGNCLWALPRSRSRSVHVQGECVCVCMCQPACTCYPGSSLSIPSHITQWVYSAASCHKYVRDLTFHALTPVLLCNNSSGIC